MKGGGMLKASKWAERRAERRRNRHGLLCIDKLKCTRCGVVMRDQEPFGPVSGEYNHPKNGCSNAGMSFVEDPARNGKQSQKARGIEPVGPKRYARAKRRGARLARKYRPR